ncbi:MAG: hypothetical protein GY828_00480 [Candidatus Gracilibacteria bacterium]|nr:hypothetical protein [Candidatus Gracilibacteria bacterium]
MNENIIKATQNILEKNLQIGTGFYSESPVVLIYDTDSRLSTAIAEGYKYQIQKLSRGECIYINEIEKDTLIEKLKNLPEFSTVILVQSTNFRLEDFRIRMTLQKQGVGCLEHNHLSYIKETEFDTYIDSIAYRGKEYTRLSGKLKDIADNAQTAKFICSDGSCLNISGGFEDMKQNIGNYSPEKRGSTLPLGENFSEAFDFDKVNGELSITCYPDSNFNIHFCEPFTIHIKNSLIECHDEKCPKIFREFLDKIAGNEGGIVYLRELGFGLNPAISNSNPLNDVNAFERKAGFHFSMGKKHGIYRKKFHRKEIQRYHIDVFPDIQSIYFDDMLVFQDGKYVI